MSNKNKTTSGKEIKDTGFSATAQSSQRYINKDGSFNVKVEGRPLFRSYDLYNHLITMAWWKFNLLVLLIYFVVNLLFAGIYYMAGIENLVGLNHASHFEELVDSFFFSAQTITTVGYGRISPIGPVVSSVAAMESLFGLLGFALATGLLYGRFARPMAKISHSTVALVAPYRVTGRGFMFRIANQRINILNAVEVQVMLSLNQDENGAVTRKFFFLDLELSKIELFPLPWTIVHPIDEKSPIYTYTIEDLVASDAEFLVSFKAYDESFSQNVHTRFSYKPDEIVWGAKFIRNFEPHPDGYTVHRLDHISDYELAELPDYAVVAEAKAINS